MGDWAGSTRLFETEQAVLTWSGNVFDVSSGSSDFVKNLVRWRCESRIGFGVLRSPGLVKIALP